MSRTQRISLGGLDFIPDLSGALYAPDFATLLVADLHLEKGTSLARRGVHLPPYDTRESLDAAAPGDRGREAAAPDLPGRQFPRSAPPASGSMGRILRCC